MFISFIIVLLISIFGLVISIRTRHYQLNWKYLHIKSSKKFLSGQELMIFCGSICCLAIPLLISFNFNYNEILDDILSDPIAILFAAAMILCPLVISLISIYIVISNFIKSHKSDFVREIILDSTLNYIKVFYSNGSTKIVPYDDVTSFIIYTHTTRVPNVHPTSVKAGIMGNNLGGPIIGAGIYSISSSSAENVKIATDIEIIISTVNGEEIKINTIGNVLFDSDSTKLLAALNQYKTKFENFHIR